MRVELYYGKDIVNLIPQLAELRLEVFSDFPYLYEGSAQYEKDYLKVYINSPKSVLVGVFDHNELVGAATALPLIDQADHVIAPFFGSDIKPEEVFYFGESVLLKKYRGLGFGHQFFESRERAAKKFGFNVTAFCAVQRSDNHPRRPLNYKPLNGFWINRGYTIRRDLHSDFSWTDIGEVSETKKKMLYWTKTL